MTRNEEAPRGAGLSQDKDAWVSDLKITDDEAMSLIVLSLATERHELALARGILSRLVEHQLPLVFGILNGNPGDLLDVVPVPASGASCIAAVHIRFSQEGYRRLAEAAKDRVAGTVDRNVDGVISHWILHH